MREDRKADRKLAAISMLVFVEAALDPKPDQATALIAAVSAGFCLYFILKALEPRGVTFKTTGAITIEPVADIPAAHAGREGT